MYYYLEDRPKARLPKISETTFHKVLEQRPPSGERVTEAEFYALVLRRGRALGKENPLLWEVISDHSEETSKELGPAAAAHMQLLAFLLVDMLETQLSEDVAQPTQPIQ